MPKRETLSQKMIDRMTNEALLSYHYHSKDTYAMDLLLQRFKGRVYKEMKALYTTNSHYDDYVQEGMIGLYNAINQYNNSGVKFFIGLADVCIKRRISNYKKQIYRKKHQVLNNYVSLDIENHPSVYGQCISSNDLSEAMVMKETKQLLMRQFMDILTDLEKKVWFYHSHQLSHLEISHQVFVPIKGVDNAMQRIKAKIKQIS